METTEKKVIPFAQIQDLLDLAERFNRQMKRELASSNGNENSLGVRQAKYLRDRYVNELNEILNEFDFNLQSLL
jgi:hypothetical protein